MVAVTPDPAEMTQSNGNPEGATSKSPLNNRPTFPSCSAGNNWSHVDAFIESYQVKYEKAAESLNKDRNALLTFYEFPAEHLKHLRTTNPIESTFAAVRHRTSRSKGCLSNRTALAMVFKLVEAAQKSWRRLDGHNQLPKLILGVKFPEGLEVIVKRANREPTTAAARPVRPSPKIAIAEQSGRNDAIGLARKAPIERTDRKTHPFTQVHRIRLPRCSPQSELMPSDLRIDNFLGILPIQEERKML
jgi:hypothetical protein